MTNPLRVAVCEDIPQEQEALLSLLRSSPVPTECTVFPSFVSLRSHNAGVQQDPLAT